MGLSLSNSRFFSFCLLAVLVLSLSSFSVGSFPSVEAEEAEASYYTKNAIWIMNDQWGSFSSDKKSVLIWHLADVVEDLRDSNITYVFVGYWNHSGNTISYTMSDYQIRAVIRALHSIDCAVLAWAETYHDNAVDVTPENRQNLYAEITRCMNKGFDGYHDDVESYVGTHQDYIDYLNNATVVLHDLGKLMTAAVGYDWQQNTNPYLHMDYIVTMFYSDRSKCEDPQGRWYWQENFGQYMGNNNPPASPLILGIMNYHGNEHPLSWQLNWIDNQLASGDGHPQLVGFSIWLYEYMSDSDWEAWKQWIKTPHPIPEPTSNPTPTPAHGLTPLEIAFFELVGVIGALAMFVIIMLIVRRRMRSKRQSP